MSLCVLYGSATGTAEDVARRAARAASARGFRVSAVAALDEFDLRLMPEQRLALFVCATTGQGSEPENMVNFWRWVETCVLSK